ncbi:MAG: hypothetical protein ACFE7E_00555 [Candidatus Hodarchaeota archaeon]
MNKNVTNRTKSIAQRVREILTQRPFLISALREDIINYTALARSLQKEMGNGSVDAIKATIMREKGGIVKKNGLREREILKLLKNTKIQLHDKIAVIYSGRRLSVPYIIDADFSSHHVYIVDQTKVKLKKEDDATISCGLVALILTGLHDDWLQIPGVIAFITQLFASQNINIREIISCYTDTIIILNPQDALKAFSLIQRYIL